MINILFASPCGPYPKASLEDDPYDMFYYRNTMGQKVFQLKSIQGWHPLHLMAQNLKVNSIVLENATFDHLTKAISEKFYEIVAISFTSISTATVLNMVQGIKKYSSSSKIVLGGYGTCIFKDPDNDAMNLKSIVDEICTGEGISFMCDYIHKHWGIESKMPFTQQLIPSRSYMFRTMFPLFEQLVLVNSLGCPNQCVFCATSAQFEGRKVVLTQANTLYNQIVSLTEKYPHVKSAIIYDEDFLADRNNVLEFIKLVKSNDVILGRSVLLTIFSSARSVEQYSIEELLWCGIGTIFIGVETFEESILERGNLSKRNSDIKELFDRLHEHGIGTLGSMILGWDDQNDNNIKNEIKKIVSLNPTFYQVIPLHPLPGTALWNQLKKQRRITSDSFSKESITDTNFVPENLQNRSIKDLVALTYSQLVDEGGPWPFRMFEVLFRGYKTMSKKQGIIFQIRKKIYRRLLVQTGPFAFAAGFIFNGKVFKKRWALYFKQYILMMFGPGIISCLIGIILLPVLQIFYLLVRLRFYFSKHGDQPPVRRFEYKNNISTCKNEH